MKKSTAGFTLVELIVVIVLIGILAAVAIPRFINQTAAARLAAMQGLQGALSSAGSLAIAEYHAEGFSASSVGGTQTITMDSTSANVTVIGKTGSPQGSAAGIGAAISNLSGFTGPTFAAGNPSTATYTLNNTTNCTVVYSDGSVASTTAMPATFSVTTAASSCT